MRVSGCVRAHAFCVREQENERERLYGMPLASLSLAGDCCFRKKVKNVSENAL